jgi:DNA-binding NarL/FixJ family response regulator
LRREEASDDQPWYVMLETVREFALERLEASGEEPAVRRRHALYYLQLAEAADDAMHGPNQVQLLNRIDREHNNCREALRWCEGQGYAEPALRTAAALWWFWVVRGYAAEGREWLNELLQRFKSHGAIGPHSQLRVRALEAAGHLASFQGDFAAARAWHQQNLPVVEEQGDASGLYRTLQNLGFVARQQEDWTAARDYLERCLAVARDGGDPDEIANALHNLANVVHDLGDVGLARTLLEECIGMFEHTGLGRSEAIAHLSLSLVALDQGDYERARIEGERALALHEQAGDRRSEVNMRTNLVNIAVAQGDFGTAQQLLVTNLNALQQLADPVATAVLLERFAVLRTAQGRAQQALRLAGAAATIRRMNHATLAPRSQIKLESELAPARDTLGASAADAAYEAGGQLSLEEAVAEALVMIYESSMLPAGQLEVKSEPVALPTAETSLGKLTAREQQIVTLIAQGATNRQIAEALVITEGTAANHVLHILNKLGFSSRTQVAVWAAQEGLLATSWRG